MKYQKFLIAPYRSGLETYTKPWMITDDAFERLNNVYNYRGRIKKRFGSRLTGSGAATTLEEQLYARPRINIDTTDGAGNTTPALVASGAIFKEGQMFSIGDEIFTVQDTGTPVTMLTTGSATTHTYDTTTGAVIINGAAAATSVFFYPAEPIMGFSMYEAGPINNHTAIAYDNQYAYKYSGGAWNKFGPTGSQWHGNDTNYYWSCNWRGSSPSDTALFVSNYNAVVGAPTADDDPIWYYDGATWTSYTPTILATGDKVLTAKILLPFKGHLILLNTIEQNNAGTINTQYVNRCRYSAVGDPTVVANSFLEATQPNSRGAGRIGAPTKEEIVSAAFIKDRLIVYFERSTWELVYTGNPGEPFLFQRLNSEFGSESTFSTVPFDKDILTIGTNGITACNGANVERIDEKIPQQVFEIINEYTGLTQIQGIRDYFHEMVYWTFPSDNLSNMNAFPNKLLAFNYKNQTWSLFDDCVTAFGYFEQQEDLTWATITTPWYKMTSSWVSGLLQSQQRQVLLGNQQGFISLVDQELTSNAKSSQISDMSCSAAGVLTLKIIDHNLNNGDFIQIMDVQGAVITGPDIYKIGVDDKDNITIIPSTFTGTYTGGGVLRRVSKIDIKSKQWNPYIEKGNNFTISKLDFCIQKTPTGKITVNYSTNSTNASLVEQATNTGAQLGDNVLELSPYDLYPIEQLQERLWHSVYLSSQGNCVQIRIYHTDKQMSDSEISLQDFELEGLTLTVAPSGRVE